MKEAGAGLLIVTVTVRLLLFWIHHYVHRTMCICGRRILAASVTTLLLGAIPYMGNLVIRHEMIPEYISQFLYGYERGVLLTVMMIGAAGVLIGIGYLLMARSWKGGKQQ